MMCISSDPVHNCTKLGISFVSHARELKLREVKQLAQGLTAYELQNINSSLH